MEEFAIDLNPAAVVRLERLSGRERFAAYLELTKPRITFLIVLTAAAGFALASQARIDYTGMVRAMVGIALLSSGIATINQYMERDLDALMRRTANRPLPSGKLLPWSKCAGPAQHSERERHDTDEGGQGNAEPMMCFGEASDGIKASSAIGRASVACSPLPQKRATHNAVHRAHARRKRTLQ